MPALGRLVAIAGIAVCAVQSAPQTTNGAANYFDVADKAVYIGVAGYQQTTGYTCGPSSTMSVMRHYGLLTAAEMNHTTEMRIADEMGTSPEVGTDIQQIAAWLPQHGMNARWGGNGTLAMLYDFIEGGFPVLIDWIDWGGHWVALTGFYRGSSNPEDGKDTFFFADPAAHFQDVHNDLGLTGFISDRFESMWITGDGHPTQWLVATPSSDAEALLRLTGILSKHGAHCEGLSGQCFRQHTSNRSKKSLLARFNA